QSPVSLRDRGVPAGEPGAAPGARWADHAAPPSDRLPRRRDGGARSVAGAAPDAGGGGGQHRRDAGPAPGPALRRRLTRHAGGAGTAGGSPAPRDGGRPEGDGPRGPPALPAPPRRPSPPTPGAATP